MESENESPTCKPLLSQSRLAQIATEVRELIRRFAALPRFREKVVEWDRNHVQRREAEEAWEKKRGEHERWACTQKRLLDEAAGPPDSGWGFEGFYLCDVADQPVAFAVGPCIGAWFPPELCRAECPEVRRPLPVPNEEVELHEKYAALAAIHDYSSKDVDSINPWKDGPDNFEGVAYTRNLLRAVHRLPETDELRLYEWIEHVEQDLKAWATPAEATPTIDPLKADVESARSDTDNEWPPTDHIAVSTIMHSAEYMKNDTVKDKNPARTTIEQWEKKESVIKKYDPQSNEVAYPQDWVSRQWNNWSPRPPKHSTST